MHKALIAKERVAFLGNGSAPGLPYSRLHGEKGCVQGATCRSAGLYAREAKRCLQEVSSR